jgi:hypothetical protein
VIRHPRPLAPAALAAAALLASCSSAGPSADASYTVTLRFCSATAFSDCSAASQASLTEIPQAVRDAFEAARARVESLVTAGLTVAQTKGRDGNWLTCDSSTSSVTMQETVHGLLVLVTLQNLGSGGVVASSGPCIARASSNLPLVAVMQFDSTWVGANSTEQLTYVATHELLHTMGFGTIWEDFSPPLLSGAGTLDASFTGANARAAAVSVNGAPASWTSLPLENCGVAAPDYCTDHPDWGQCCTGTRDSHWENEYFGDELMTAYVTTPAAPLSASTIGALRDLGYQVDMSRAETFTLLDPSALRALSSSPALDLSHDVLRIPLQYADDTAPAP